MSTVVFITGASTGIGKDTALLLAKRGMRVYAAARRVELIEAYASDLIIPVALDVTDGERVQTVVSEIVEKEGRIDILINNAGYGSYGAIEDVPIEEGIYQFDVNVIAVARLIQAVLPSMRERKTGKIINISSIAGKIYEPLGSWYHSTKFAIEGMSDSLRVELKPHGIDVIIIEPGPIMTEWNTIARNNLLKTSGTGPYKEQAQALSTLLANFDQPPHGTESLVVAKVIEKSILAKKPKTRYPVGRDAQLMMCMRKILSDRMVDFLLDRTIKNAQKK